MTNSNNTSLNKDVEEKDLDVEGRQHVGSLLATTSKKKILEPIPNNGTQNKPTPEEN